MAQQPKDPNMMTSPLLRIVATHWFASIKAFILYLILYLAIFSFTTGTTFINIISALTLVAWIFFDYTDTYRKAMRDVNVVKYGYLKYDKLRGLKSGLLAQIPGLLLVILIFLTRGSDASDLFRMFYSMLYMPLVHWIGILEEVTYLALLLPLIVVPISGFAGYYCGYNGLASGTMNQLIYRKRNR